MKDRILKLAKSIKHHPLSLLAFYDDAGDIVYNSSRVLIKVDGFAFSRARYAWCSYRDVGFRAVTAAISDVVAKGCRPAAYAISIGLTRKSIDMLEEVVRGVIDATTIYGGYIANIDTNSGDDDWIDVFVIADCKYAPIPRNIRPCSAILLPRRIGDTTIAYISHMSSRFDSLNQNIVEVSCRPLVELKLVEVIEKHRDCITGSIDISDTFAETLHDLAEISRYGIYVNTPPYTIASYNLINFYYSNRHRYGDLMELILMANEEYIPILAIDSWCIDKLTLSLTSIGFEPTIIGYGIAENEISWMGRRIPKLIWDHVYSRILINE